MGLKLGYNKRKIDGVQAMEILKERIRHEAKSYPGNILKVDSFINHQIDPQLMYAVALEFRQLFADLAFDKIITVEASGIAPAVFLGYVTGKQVVYVKKRMPATMAAALTTTAHSFTKNRDYPLTLSRQFVRPGEKFLFIDDFLASGHAALAIIDLLKQGSADLVGMGVIIEKGFQAGGALLRIQEKLRVESLVTVQAMDNGHIHLQD